jgi:hypothetical protein
MSAQTTSQDVWTAATLATRGLIDRYGTPMDEGIVRLVTTLRVLGVKTTGSCEGHPNSDEKAFAFPFVVFSPQDEPLIGEMLSAFYRVCGLPTLWEAVLLWKPRRLECNPFRETNKRGSPALQHAHDIRLQEMNRFSDFLRMEVVERPHPPFSSTVTMKRMAEERFQRAVDDQKAITEELIGIWKRV